MLSRPGSRQRTVLPNDVVSTIECGQLHSELLGRRYSTLQSHGLFALAKHLLLLSYALEFYVYSKCCLIQSNMVLFWF